MLAIVAQASSTQLEDPTAHGAVERRGREEVPTICIPITHASALIVGTVSAMHVTSMVVRGDVGLLHRADAVLHANGIRAGWLVEGADEVSRGLAERHVRRVPMLGVVQIVPSVAVLVAERGHGERARVCRLADPAHIDYPRDEQHRQHHAPDGLAHPPRFAPR